MKTRLFTSFLAAAVLLLFALSFAQTTTPPVEHGSNFVDANGDGYNDNAPDADGDGIPNGQDPDYIKPADGSGAGKGRGAGTKGFVDENGDGINDNAPDADGDGIPNGQDPDYVKPADGSGAGKGQGKGMGKGGKFHGFVDEDGDGINDNLRDADKDGVPNCQDGDWVRPMDGSGAKAGKGARGGRGFGKGPAGQNSGSQPGNQGGKGK